jgi:hypothetical protein
MVEMGCPAFFCPQDRKNPPSRLGGAIHEGCSGAPISNLRDKEELNFSEIQVEQHCGAERNPRDCNYLEREKS